MVVVVLLLTLLYIYVSALQCAHRQSTGKSCCCWRAEDAELLGITMSTGGVGGGCDGEESIKVRIVGVCSTPNKGHNASQATKSVRNTFLATIGVALQWPPCAALRPTAKGSAAEAGAEVTAPPARAPFAPLWPHPTPMRITATQTTHSH